MKKTMMYLTCAILAVLMTLVIAACGGGSDSSTSDGSGSGSDSSGVGGIVSSVVDQAVESAKLTAARLVEGNIKGEVGKVYSAKWFDFTIESIEKISSIEGYSPEDGNILIKAVVTEKGTFEEPGPMGTFDFYLDSETFEEYVWAMPPLNDSMMPEEFDLDTNEIVKYTLVFEVPDGLDDLQLMYTEVDERDSVYATFVIDVRY